MKNKVTAIMLPTRENCIQVRAVQTRGWSPTGTKWHALIANQWKTNTTGRTPQEVDALEHGGHGARAHI